MQKSFILLGLINYDPEKTFNGYTLYEPMQLTTEEWRGLYSEPSYAYLIDMHGNEVHTWHLPSMPGCHGVLLENGNLLVVCIDGSREKFVTTGRHLDCMFVIDKKTGEIEKRIGAYSYLDSETGCIEHRKKANPVIPLKIPTLGGPHAAYVISGGCPGAGNYLLYDNGIYADTSRAVEFSKDTTTENPIVVWESCQGTLGRKHYSNFISAAQRLPNGNTLICDGAMGRFFELVAGTHDEVVWEFVNPHTPCKFYNGAVFRAHRYGPDHCPQFKTLPPPNK